MLQKVAWLFSVVNYRQDDFLVILQYVDFLYIAGYKIDLYIFEEKSSQELKSEINRFYKNSYINVYSGWNIKDDYNFVIATDSHSAFFINRIKQISAKKIYFVSDFEPYRYPMGEKYIIAENSYRLDLPIIAVGKWLSYKLHNDYGLKNNYCDFYFNNQNFYCNARLGEKEFAVCFYYNPAKSNSCHVLGMQALKLLKKSMPELKVYLFGSLQKMDHFPEYTNLGCISDKEKNILFNKCLAGLCINSANPSSIIFEMMHSGLPVVNIYRENNCYDFSNDVIVLAESNSESIKQSLFNLLSDKTLLKKIEDAARNYTQDKSFKSCSDSFIKALNNTLENKFILEANYFKKQSYQLLNFSKEHYLDINSFKPSHKLFTFDIWDTVLRRVCHPDEVKLFTCKYIFLRYYQNIKIEYSKPEIILLERLKCEGYIAKREKNLGNDEEYTIFEVFKLLLGHIFDKNLADKELEDIVKELIIIEVNQEKKVSYLDKKFKLFYKKCAVANKCFVSDFYISKDQLIDILKNKGFNIKLGYVSCDEKMNKRNPKFFSKISKAFNVEYAKQIHIGDNEYSDYFMPHSLGIDAKIFVNEDEEKKRKIKNERFLKRTWDFSTYISELIELLQNVAPNQEYKDQHLELYNLGRKYSTLFLNFLIFICENLIKEKIEKVYFFTREGEFFYKIYNLIVENNPFDIDLPEAEILEVSRIATFSPSLRNIDTFELMRIWNTYSTQSIKGLFSSLDIQVSKYEKYLLKYKLELNEDIKHPWLDQRVNNLFLDVNFIKNLREDVNEKKELILKYFEQKGLSADCQKVAVVDMGWRGTIQDNLCYLFPETKFFGFYFGLNNFLNIQPKNSIKLCFGPNENEKISEVEAEESKKDKEDKEEVNLIKFVSPLEMLCNSLNGSTIGYENRNGKVFAKKEINSSENSVFFKYTKYFQEGVCSFTKDFCEFLKNYAVSSSELRPYSIKILEILVNNPSKIIAEAYFNLNHNETFGVGCFEDKKKFLSKINEAREIYFSGDRENFNKFLVSTSWPQGFCKICDIEYIFFYFQHHSQLLFGKNKVDEAEGLFLKSIELFRKDEIVKAKQKILLSLSKTPDNIKAIFLLAKILCKENKLRLAVQWLKISIVLNKNHGPAYNELACLMFEEGLEEESVKLLKKLIKILPKYKLAYLNIAKVYIRLKKFYEAQEILIKFLEFSKDDKEALLLFTIVNNFSSSVNIMKIKNLLLTDMQAYKYDKNFLLEIEKANISQIKILTAGNFYKEKFILSLIKDMDYLSWLN